MTNQKNAKNYNESALVLREHSLSGEHWEAKKGLKKYINIIKDFAWMF